MKRINWKAVNPQKISENTFWFKCHEDELASEEMFAELTSKFSSKVTKIKEKSVTRDMEKSDQLRVISKQSAQNILILLKASLKQLSFEQIKRDILHCDTSILNVEIIERLIQCLPPSDQLKRLKEINNIGGKLSEAEKFVSTLGEIKNILPRLHCIIFKQRVEKLAQQLKNDIEIATLACLQVKRSEKFAKILEFILLLGNYMNSGHGMAFGFEFSCLTQLKDIMDSDNKQSLMDYMVETIAKKIPDLLTFGEELTEVDKAASITMESIQERLYYLTTSLKNLDVELENSKIPQSVEDKFIEEMINIPVQFEHKINDLNVMKNRLVESRNDLKEYFAFDKYTMDEFLFDIKAFTKSFTQAHEKILNIQKKGEKTHLEGNAHELLQRQLTQRLHKLNSGLWDIYSILMA